MLQDNSGKFTEADHAKIIDLLEKCFDRSEMDALRDNINKLNEYGIKPGEYEANGINDPQKLEVAAEAISKIRYNADYATHLK